ncbi:metal-dependent hydrolase [Erythrobacter sp. JK5]|uniref:metal-dependent hydrolase n=1 Tax=Erythrobacter sp. JK5 TaxID=2829500 RepID=UPI001BADCCF0|nr:metal-dependent hydrolase [Erythrobacter sp. JK5]QUL38561.1 metal-dependent hydrolase [Erythrobacter sp. JK5]
MDNITHSLVGAVLGQAGLKKKTGLAMPALIIGANLPDVDAACFFWLEGTEHLGFRRGITHGPPAMVLLPLILAGLLWAFDRWQEKRGQGRFGRPEGRLPVNFKWLFLLSFIGCLSHPALDWLNVYGIRLLEPFSSQWFYGDTLFIIDVWLWALLIGSVCWSLRSEKRGGNWTRPAWVGIAGGLAYIGMNGLISASASEDANRAAQATDFLEHGHAIIASPVPLAFWERETIYSSALLIEDFSAATWKVGNWSFFGGMAGEVILPVRPCNWAGLEEQRRTNPQLDAFLFWSRAPFATRAEDGSVVLHDARFYDPRARDRFSVALPDVECEELPVP